MCIAIVVDSGKVLDNASLYRGWSSNPDGGGFAFVKDGKVEIRKGFMSYNAFQKAYEDAAKDYSNTSPFLIHMRIRTSGATNQKNCHPFPVKGGAMIHNGIMFTPTGARAGKPEDRKSDTRVFCEDLYNILNIEHVRAAEAGIRKAIGGGNKLCFLYDDKQVHIVGEDLGHWDDRIWYSNSSCSTMGRRY